MMQHYLCMQRKTSQDTLVTQLLPVELITESGAVPLVNKLHPVEKIHYQASLISTTTPISWGYKGNIELSTIYHC